MFRISKWALCVKITKSKQSSLATDQKAQSVQASLVPAQQTFILARWDEHVPKFELDPDTPLQAVLVHTAGKSSSISWNYLNLI